MLFGEIRKKKPWIKDLFVQPITKNMATGKHPEFLLKGVYKEPGNVAAALLRPLLEPKIPFKLHTKGLLPSDVNLVFGQWRNKLEEAERKEKMRKLKKAGKMIIWEFIMILNFKKFDEK